MRVLGPDALQVLAATRRMFKDVPLVHVGSLLADGMPHVVPLWFVWLDDATVVVTCREGSQVWANLERDARVTLAFERGRAWTEHAGLMVRGRAEPVAPDESTGKRALSAWFDKYREELAGPGFAAYTEDVIEPRMFRVRPVAAARWAPHAPRSSSGG